MLHTLCVSVCVTAWNLRSPVAFRFSEAHLRNRAYACEQPSHICQCAYSLICAEGLGILGTELCIWDPLLAISFLLRHDLWPGFFAAANFCNRRQEVGIVCGFSVTNCRGKAFGMLPYFLTVRFFPSALPLALSKTASQEVGGPGRQPMQHTCTYYLKTAHHTSKPIIHAKALRSPSRSAPGRISGPGFGHEHVSN